MAGPTALAQPFSFGIKAGVPVTDFLSATPNQNGFYTTALNRYIVGAAAELYLPLGLGVEIDGLYRHYGYDNGPYTANKASTGDWEFPALVKYRLGEKLLRPYVDAGVAVDTLVHPTQTYTLELIDFRNYTIMLSDPNELHRRTIAGFVAGAGMDLSVRHLHFQPEVRFTRWNGEHFQNTIPSNLSSNQNQVELLLGITFR
jgi:hypothetical protein